MRIGTLPRDCRATILAIVTVVLGRALLVYGLLLVGSFFGRRISLRRQHILVAGGIRRALVLSLARHFPYREQISP